MLDIYVPGGRAQASIYGRPFRASDSWPLLGAIRRWLPDVGGATVLEGTLRPGAD